MDGYIPMRKRMGGELFRQGVRLNGAGRKEGFTAMKNRITKCLAMVAVLCVLATAFAVPLASAASYSKVYGRTQEKVRVREVHRPMRPLSTIL